MGRSEDFELIIFGWFQAVGGCLPIETALKTLIFIFGSCHHYTYIYIGIERAANTILSIEIGVSSIKVGVSSKSTFFVLAGKRYCCIFAIGNW